MSSPMVRNALKALLLSLALLLAVSPTASAVDTPAGQQVQDEPATGTPHLLDGRVLSIAQVGTSMVVGGTFTSARNYDSATQYSRARLMAFNRNTGQISTSFLPNPNGTINVVIPAGDGQSVYVGGSFTSIGGVARSNVARVRISDGAVLTAFNAGTVSGQVKDLRLANGRLWLAGAFTHVNGRAQKALATVNATTGAFDTFMTQSITGIHNDGYTTVAKIDVNPTGTQLAAVGNFDLVDGVKRHQMFVLAIGGTTSQTGPLATHFYEPSCSSAFDSYMRDVDFSPNGSFFVVSTTGAYGGSEGPCDTTSRWESNAAGSDVTPSWVDYTGGDTTYGVEVTDSVVYTGGHARWQNNAYAGDSPGPGAVARPGIAALDPINGLPLSWNPTRTRGVGVFDFLMTDQGLWVGSDTDRIGSYQYRGKLALMPVGGATIPAISTPTLPNDIYTAGALGASTDPSIVYRVNAGGPAVSAATGIDWSADTDGDQSAYHNHSSNRAGYGSVPTVDSSVPSGTPREIFDTELWDPSDATEQQWEFPVAAGTPLEVRLYFANRCTCTAGVGQRVFNVDIDGERKLSNFDMVAEKGHDVGFMKSFNITSDGTVDIDLGHVVENSMINGIEIRRTNAAPASPSAIVKRNYNGTTVGATSAVPSGSKDWNTLRGGFMINGKLYTAWADGTFTRQTFNGSSYGSPVAVDTGDELVPNTAWAGDIQQARGMFYDSGRIYFTRSGSDQLYYRYFTAESDVVGAKRLVASGSVPGLDLSQVRGMFLSAGKLYWASPDGVLHSIDWQPGAAAGGPLGGTAAAVSGPGIDGNSWASRAMFLYQDAAGNGAGAPPSAAFSFNCTSRTCAFDASASTAPGSTISGYSWDFGDGTASGKTVQHTFGQDGTFSVTLNISTANGGTDSDTQLVDVVRVNQPPTASFTVSCAQLTCSFNAAGSGDPDGSLSSYAWNFGDAETAVGPNPSHTYDNPGSYSVTLTVTDNDGTTAITQREANATAQPAAQVSFVGAANTNANRTNHTVTVPGGVQAGDLLVLFLTLNGAPDTVPTPAGWTLQKSADASAFASRVWTRTATGSDSGAPVSVATTSYLKSNMTVAAYRGTGGALLKASEVAVASAAGTSHTSPTVPVVDSNSWLVSYWSDKSAGGQSWTTPAGQVQRATGSGTGSGAASGVLVDSGASVQPGTGGGITATSALTASRVAKYSLVIGPS